jgi:hypothetical protein
LVANNFTKWRYSIFHATEPKHDSHGCIPSWTLTSINIIFSHDVSFLLLSPPADLDLQVLSKAHLEQEMRAQFTMLAMEWDFKENVAPLPQRAPQALPS